MNKELNVIDLFSGCGGLSYGLEKAGYNILLGIDNDEIALKTFEFNHKGAKSLFADISKISYEKDIKPIINEKKIDLVVGGPPCQGMSISGPRKFNDPRNELYLSFIRIVNEIKPKAFIIENVPGLARLYGGKIKESIINKFEEMGYIIKDKILTASDYGVPQKRKRIFFVGLKDDEFEFPDPLSEHITCEMALSDLPTLENELGSETQSYLFSPQNYYQEIMRMNSEEIKNHIAANHSERIKKIISLVPDGGNYKDLPDKYKNTRKFNVAWTRFASDKPAPTIDTGHRHHFHYKYNRVPTVRESARLQSFPDDFVFIGNKTQQFRQVGNAVPPILAEKLGLKLKEYLIDYDKKI